jgi:CHAT domain-containing protein
VLADRLELLLSHGPDLRRVTVPVTGARVQDTARRFRTEVERRRTQAYLEPAQTLHQWLLAPIDRQLQTWGVSTLVVVPDPALRSIPFAALHDGKEFAIRRYAIAMVPGLDLTDPRPLPRQGVQTLLAGVTESVQGYPTLEHVDGELRSIHKLFGGELLLNADFRHERLEQALTARRYRIAHIASHGEFAGNVAQSFVLAYDRKISMDELSRFIGYNRFRDDPLDLLTLSACHTAAGDERAALGLAGIAVKAGARSAVAALWPIHDEAAAVLMEEFYRQLHTPETSKAVALQRAQTKLAGLTRYRHPGYWSSFVLIGSWR